MPPATADNGVIKDGEVVSLSRFEAEAAATQTSVSTPRAAASSSSLFIQLFSQLRDTPPIKLRRRDRAFRVKFIGESSDDHGGPYREALTYICAELQSPVNNAATLLVHILPR
eukprot:1916525-Pleurochrysis_carterae.AAC.1